MSAPHEFAHRTWPDMEDAFGRRLVALLPVGSTEAHGPHLPLNTDVIIAEGMAREAARRLEGHGLAALCLPALAYGVTECAAEFPGTISVSPAAVQVMLGDIASSLMQQGASMLCLVNAHLEPAHRHALRAAAEAADPSMPVLFPDKVRRRFAERLDDEFRSGACHAGSYETSMVMALRPDLVREELRRTLPANPISLGQALHEGKRTFKEAGSDDAYFGAPAEASREHGEHLLGILGELVVEKILAATRDR